MKTVQEVLEDVAINRLVDSEVAVFVLNEHNYGYHSTLGKVKRMNYSTAIFLISNKVRAVYAIYEPDGDREKVRRYMFKTFDTDLKVGDYVVVPSTVKLKLDVARITEVDVSVDFDSVTSVDWIVGSIDLVDFKQVAVEEAAAIEVIKKAQYEDKREALAASLTKHRAELKALPISKRK